MALSSAVDAAVAPPAPNPVHGHDEQSGHAHADHVRAGHSHLGHSPAAPARPTSRRPEVRIGASVLRLSLLARLAIAGTLLAVLWTVVSLVVGSEP